MIIIVNKERLIIFFVTLAILLFLIYKYVSIEKTIVTYTTPKGYIAIVIDDLGSDEHDGVDELFKLDILITVAIMPFLDYTKIDVKKLMNLQLQKNYVRS